MAVGSRYEGSNAAHNKAELYSHSTSSWKAKARYPFYEDILAFEIVLHSDSFILFGGWTVTGDTDIIAKFNPGLNQWTKLGTLRASRHAFGVFQTDKKYLVMGGGANGNFYRNTEVCEFENETIECTSREPTLYKFRYFPAMMIVASDYADNC